MIAVIRSQGEGAKLSEFGKLVQLQEAENQIITHYEMFNVRDLPGGYFSRQHQKHRSEIEIGAARIFVRRKF